MPTTLTPHPPNRANTRENHPVRAANGLAGAKRVLGWSGARKAARSTYSESAAPSVSDTSVSAVASATAAPSTDPADSPTSSARSAASTLTPRISNSRRNIRDARRPLAITEHVTRQPVTLVRNRARTKQTRIRHANKTINKTNTSRQDRTLHKKTEETQTGNKRANNQPPAVGNTAGMTHHTTPIELHVTKEESPGNTPVSTSSITGVRAPYRRRAI